MKKEWFILPRSKCYEISSIGEIRNRGSKRVLKPYYTGRSRDKRRLTVYIYDDIKHRYRHLKVHRLLYEAYKGIIDETVLVRFKNGNEKDIRISNLEGFDISDHNKKLGHRVRLVEECLSFNTLAECAAYLRCSRQNIYRVLDKPNRTIYGNHVVSI